MKTLRIISLLVVLMATGVRANAAQNTTFALSPAALKGARLVDARSFDAAQQFFLRELGNRPNDAGMYCQYVRFMILSRSLAYPDFAQSGLYADGQFYWSSHLAAKAASIASQLNPKCKSYLANLIMASFASNLTATLQRGEGCIGQGATLYFPEVGESRKCYALELSMLNICWDAVDMAPETSSKWGDRYTPLLDKSIRLGKVATATMLGNLIGDMKQGGKGSQDFIMANKAFLESMDHYKSGPGYNYLVEDLVDVANSYPTCFRNEMLSIRAGKMIDPNFQRLKVKLARWGVEIPQVEPVNPNIPRTSTSPKK